MQETFNTPRYLRGIIEVKYAAYTAEWQITNKTRAPYIDVAANTTYGTDRANAYRILEDSLNLWDIGILHDHILTITFSFPRRMPWTPKLTEFIYCIKDHFREMQFHAFFGSGKRPSDEVFASKT